MNETPATQSDIERIIDSIRELGQQVNSRLDMLNGKVGRHETDIAIIKTRMEDKDRADDKKREDARQVELISTIKNLVKDYGSPVSVIGMIVYLMGKSRGWW